MGSKGQSTANTQTNQSQTYNPAGAGYVQSALQQGQAAAQTPFSQPVAPVAGFSQDQQSAFNTVNSAQGMAQPYINQAAQDFTPQGTQAFLNPYASNVMAQMQNQFGEQQQQATGQLTQAAGGVGADRIAVGQADLANQQSLAAGQTMSSLYNNAAQQAQSAGYGTAALGSQAQNAALQGAQAQLGTGGLQQQLSQAQLNAPYQQQLAQLAYPFQTAQFNAGITGALAPGLGGTTSGTGNSATQSQAAPPSIWSQLLGLGAAGAGLYGGFSGTNSGTGKGGTSGTGIGPTSMNGQLSSPMSVPGYQSAARGGTVYARGGDVGYDDGGATADPAGLPSGPFGQVPQGFDNQPINVAPKSVVPTEQLTPIKANVPQLNLNPPQQPAAAASSGPDLGSIVGTAAKIGAMFIKRGGAIPYAKGGYADGGDTSIEDRFGPVKDAITGGDFDPVGGNSTTFEGQPGMASSNTGTVPIPKRRPRSADLGDDGTTALGFAGPDSPKVFPYAPPAGAAKPAGAPAAVDPEDDHTPTNTAVPPSKDPGFAGSPWAALMQAGLAIAGGSSPYAGVNIGKGGLEGLKTLESQREAAQKDTTINQAAKRLQMEADHHTDAMTKLTKAQSVANERADARDEEAKRQFNRPYEELTKQQQAVIDRAAAQDKESIRQADRPYNEMTKAEQARDEESRRQHDLARVPEGFRKRDDGSLEPVPGGTHDPETIRKEAEAKRPPGMSDEAIAPLVESYMAGNTGVLSGVGRGTQGAQNLEKFWTMTAQKLKDQGMTGKDLAAARANFMAQSAGARVAAQRESNIETAVNEAKGTFPEVLRTSAALPRTNYPAINKAMEFARTNTGSPEQRQFGAAMQAAVTAYSQAMSRTGVNSVYAQQHAADILSKVDGHEALKAGIDQLNTEMAIAKAAPEETRQNILNRILGIKTGTPPPTSGATTPQTPPAGSTPVKVGSPADAAKLEPGTHYVTPDGKEFVR